MNNKDKLTSAVNAFHTSEKCTDDYIDFMQVVQNITRQGSGMMWDEIRSCIDDALDNSGEWFNIYPSFSSYMFSIDQQLEVRCGLGYQHLPDFNWRDAYDDEILPNDIVDVFMKKEFPIYN